MIRKSLLLFISALMAFGSVKADEGMWFLMFIKKQNHKDMQKMGLKLSADEIYSINNSSLKDAIVQFGGGCTAEMISADGLVLTNHYCGYGSIAELSDAENDYLTNGFWAADRPSELKPKQLSVRFFVRMDDVSKRILGKVNNKMSEEEREKIIAQEIAMIEKENSENGKYVVSVRPFFNGNEYYYFVYQDYTDVRLVGTSPNNIGKFGGDTDNWEWPRHTGDFALFRVYADKDGNPAPYSKENIPLKPKHYLPVSLKGVQENDFAMILGYPGRTNRWMPAGGIEQNVNYAYPAWVEASKMGMDQMKKHMDKDPQVRIDYASKYAQVANYWKNRQGMIEALNQHKTSSLKSEQEVKFNEWANKKSNQAQYGDVIATINKYYEATNAKARHDNYLLGLLRTSTFGALPFSLGAAVDKYLALEDGEAKAEMLEKIRESINDSYAKLYMPLEKDVLAAQLTLYSSKAKDGGIAPYVAELEAKNNGNFQTFVEDAFSQSVFADKSLLLATIEGQDAKNVITNDPLYKLSNDLIARYRAKPDDLRALESDFNKSYRLMVNGMRTANPKVKYYPDANSTLRLTYGKVRALPADPRNDAKVNFITTLDGTIAKYKPNDEEFDLPAKLIELHVAKDYGRYADKDGFMPVNFLTDNDITGGNSGSFVLNGKGELIGLAFDGNIEAMSGDVIFEQNLQRTINVDIRYVLFIIDKFAGASHIIEELKIVE